MTVVCLDLQGKIKISKIKLPNEFKDNDVLYFKHVQKQLKVSFIMYADFESYLEKCEEQELDHSVSFTHKTKKHKSIDKVVFGRL